MLSIGLTSLIFALTAGVFGFGAHVPPVWTLEKGLFLFFLIVAAASLAGGSIGIPPHWGEALGLGRANRLRYIPLNHGHRTDRRLT